MAYLAIENHTTRGKEIIEILEMLGGKNIANFIGDSTKANSYYTIGEDGYIHMRLGNINDDYIKFTLEEFLEKFPYKVGDKVLYKTYGIYSAIKTMKWNSEKEQVFYRLDSKNLFVATVDELKPCKEEPMENKGTLVEIDLTREESKAEEIEVILGDYEFVLKNGKTYFVKKKPKYPKTYVDCCAVLYPNENFQTVSQPIKGHNGKKLFVLQKLLICRDAYWKIAGEQMGLGKPWEPYWTIYKHKFCLGTDKDKVIEECVTTGNRILAFPAEEMRNAFYENFKELIETCKELL